ncbi:hypothetical protein BDN72DRAFT_309354 [Pluteus cervinus]|uniref:Uncharacterized protein n=1 Tax=Pluteus cervinus TaxID=181527 RepID=A0ACD3ADW9_9AGAR|nr:hypothetical protein BDN72DRAFT_309354 [Pluteus cervinus]
MRWWLCLPSFLLFLSVYLDFCFFFTHPLDVYMHAHSTEPFTRHVDTCACAVFLTALAIFAASSFCRRHRSYRISYSLSLSQTIAFSSSAHRTKWTSGVARYSCQ